MIESPKELTPELLSLILSSSEIGEIKVYAINEIVKDEIIPNTSFLILILKMMNLYTKGALT